MSKVLIYPIITVLYGANHLIYYILINIFCQYSIKKVWHIDEKNLFSVRKIKHDGFNCTAN